MASTFASEKQRKLFAAIENCGELVFAAGPRGGSRQSYRVAAACAVSQVPTYVTA